MGELTKLLVEVAGKAVIGKTGEQAVEKGIKMVYGESSRSSSRKKRTSSRSRSSAYYYSDQDDDYQSDCRLRRPEYICARCLRERCRC
jgi:hypothetical protein